MDKLYWLIWDAVRPLVPSTKSGELSRRVEKAATDITDHLAGLPSMQPEPDAHGLNEWEYARNQLRQQILSEFKDQSSDTNDKGLVSDLGD